MKKTFFLLLALYTFASAQSAAEPMARLISYNANRPKALAPKFAQGETVSYCAYLANGTEAVTNEEDFDKHIRLTLKLWKAYPAYLIRKSGRAQEFADVLPALEKEPKFIRRDGCDFSQFPKEHLHLLNPQPAQSAVQPADISYFFENAFFAAINGRETIPSYFTYNPIPHIHISKQARQNYALAHTWSSDKFNETNRFFTWRERFLSTPLSDRETIDALMNELNQLLREFGYSDSTLLYVLLHETGHAFGLADQHKWINNDKIYTTVETRDSVMDYNQTFLTCDDADGIITLFDDALGLKRSFKSLCDDGIAFENGKEAFEGDKTMESNTRDCQTTRTYHADTKDTGIYDWKESLYVDLAEESAKEIDEKFDLSLMKEKWGGYQTSQGKLKFMDIEDTSKGSYPVGEHFMRLTIGPGMMYKQTIVEHYDDKGNLLDYTLDIYDTPTDTVKESRFVKVK